MAKDTSWSENMNFPSDQESKIRLILQSEDQNELILQSEDHQFATISAHLVILGSARDLPKAD